MDTDLFIVEWAVADPLATNHELLALTGNKPDPSHTLTFETCDAIRGPQSRSNPNALPHSGQTYRRTQI